MKCPSCNATPITPTMQAFETGVPLGMKWKCIAFNCPKCKVVLGTQVDPVAIKYDIVQDLLRALRP